VILEPANGTNAFSVVNTIRATPDIRKEYGMPLVEQARVTVVESRPEPANASLMWYRVSISDGDFSVETPFWVLYDLKLGIIEDAYALDFSEIQRGTSTEFLRLLTLRDVLADTLKETSVGYGSEVLGLMSEKNSVMKVSRPKSKTGPVLQLGGQNVESVEVEVEFKPTLLGKLIGRIGGAELKAISRGYKKASVYIVPSESVKNVPYLLKLNKDTVAIVGYRVVLGSGLVVESFVN
jgi:hypothetical protein